MKPLAISTLIPSLLLVLSVTAVAGKEVINYEVDSNTGQVVMKCHVVLVNGNEAIAFWRTPQKKPKYMKRWVVGRKILPQKSTEKVKIYSAHQCVLENEAFSNTKSQLLDEKTER